jgi:type IV secretion system protein VirB2
MGVFSFINQSMNTRRNDMKTQAMNNFPLVAAVIVAAAAVAFVPDTALASGGISDFAGPFEMVMNTITGPWGRIISVAGMAICGVVFIFNRQDMGEGFKMMLQVVFGICFICFAATMVDAMFGTFSGAVL